MVGAKVQKVEEIRTSPSKSRVSSKLNPPENTLLDSPPAALLRVERCSGTLFLPVCAGWQVWEDYWDVQKDRHIGSVCQQQQHQI